MLLDFVEEGGLDFEQSVTAERVIIDQWRQKLIFPLFLLAIAIDEQTRGLCLLERLLSNLKLVLACAGRRMVALGWSERALTSQRARCLQVVGLAVLRCV